jgi:uncharacterized protein
MGQPVVHFEIIGNDPEKLRGYYGDLFGWEFDSPSPVAQEVSEPGSYGYLDLLTSEDGTGIRGGVGGGPGYKSHAVFYVGVPDVEAALQRAESLGGTRVMGSSHITEWSCRRSLQGPRRHPDRRRRRRMRAASQPAHLPSSAGRRQTIHLLLARPGKQPKQMGKDGMIMAMQRRVTGRRR